jgi:hypothetical protein
MAAMDPAVGHLSPGGGATALALVAGQNQAAILAGVADAAEGTAVKIGSDGRNVQGLGADVLDGLNAGKGECLRDGADSLIMLWERVESVWSTLLLLEPGFNFLPGKAPLPAYLEAMEAAVAQHAVDGDAVNLEQVLELFGCEQIVHG